MNKLLISSFLVCFIINSYFSVAQSESKVYNERVAAIVNNDFLITGETLYFSIHCLEEGKNNYSPLSKVAYVELVGENEQPFLQAKIPLIKGRGAGDFFLSSTLPSGNYTLIAYTKWMRNFPLKSFFQKQITIINPYLKPLTETKSNATKADVRINSIPDTNADAPNELKLNIDQKKYSHRQKVTIAIKNNSQHTYQISLNAHRSDKTLDTVNSKVDLAKVNSSLLTNFSTETKSISFLPDLRGETIGGIAKEASTQKPLTNTEIYLSAPGSSYVFQVFKTDSTGRFYFSTKNIQAQNGIRFQAGQSSSSVLLEVALDNEFINDYRKFKPLPFSIDTTLRKQIEQRNVYSQIENAYFSKKKDSVLSKIQVEFFDKPDKVFKLDDFIRFPTMEDIFREYMYEVFVLKRDGKFSLRLMNSNSSNGARFPNSPLLLVDGIRVFDTETLMNYNPLLIKTISLVTRSYIYAGVLYDGILSINTYTGTAQDLPVPFIQKDYTSWQHSKKYYSPAYENNKGIDRIPDYRFQLFWNPLITIEPGQEYIAEFYTSDLNGTFVIEANGFNSQVEALNGYDTIEVKN